MNAATYFMETAAEGERVERKTDRKLTVSQLEWAGLTAGSHAADVGCAAGTTSRIMADLVGAEGQIIGLDRSYARLHEAVHDRGDHRVAYVSAAAESLPIAENTFDFTWSRFLLEYVAHPEAVVREMVRVTRPGGNVCLADLDGNGVWTEPLPSDLAEERAEAVDLLRTAGFDPHVGRRLYTLAATSGLSNLRVDIRPYNVIAGIVRDAATRDRWELKHAGIQSGLISLGWTATRATKLVQRFRARLSDPASFSYSVLITVAGTKNEKTIGTRDPSLGP